MAKVLVGVPTKNRPHYVREAVSSILAQTFQDFRVIVSDNCSEDAAVRDVRDFVSSLGDPRVTYVLQPTDGQEYGQGRYLFGECREQYFVILHDDDLLAPEHLAEAVQCLDAHPDVALFGTGQRLIDEAGRPLPEMTAEYDRQTRRDVAPEGRIANLADHVVGEGVFSISGTVFRASALREFGLADDDCEGLFPFEFNVFLRQAEHGAVAFYTRRPMVAYRFHGGRQGSYTGIWCWNEQQTLTMTKLLERRRFVGTAEVWRRRLLSKAYRNHGYMMFVEDRWRDGYGLLARSVRLDPMHWQVWAYAGFALFFPFLVGPLCRSKVRLLPR